MAADAATRAGNPAAFEDRYFSAQDGLRLHARDYHPAGISTAPSVVCLPGLTRNARDFHHLALHLSRNAEHRRRVVAFDYRGRGGSARDPDPANYTLTVETGDVIAGLTALGIHEAAFIGTSRGALIIHMLAAMRPGAIRSAIFNDAGPVVDGAGLARIKSYLERMPPPRDWDHAAALLRETHGASFPVLGQTDWMDMARAIYIEHGGRFTGDHDPALVRQLAAIDFNTPLPTLWPQFNGLARIPLMVIRGANSQLLSEKTLAAMRARRPDMTSVTVEGQGHAPLLHLGDLPERIDAFLTDTASARKSESIFGKADA